MLITEVKSLEISDIKIIKFKRFHDQRGYFTETFREDDFYGITEMAFIRPFEFLQFNETYSHKNTFRGLHFQWNPFMGKLVRCISGHLIDMALDIRKGSPTYGKIVAYELKSSPKDTHSEWMWLPPGFAHGALTLKESYLQYLCTGTYNPKCEAAIAPIADDIDWSICNPKIEKKIKKAFDGDILIKERDWAGMTMAEWLKNKNSDKFIYLEE